MSAWLAAFVFTQIVEIPIYRRALDGRFWVAFGASAITHPVVWFLFPLLPLPYLAYTAAAEVFAVVVEALYLRAFGLKNALAWSLLANGASLSLGLLSRYLFGMP
jgi:hypothetical protein